MLLQGPVEEIVNSVSGLNQSLQVTGDKQSLLQLEKMIADNLPELECQVEPISLSDVSVGHPRRQK